MRNPGPYEVRRYHDDPQWTIAQLAADGFWYTIGDSPALRENDFAEIGRRIVLLHEMKE